MGQPISPESSYNFEIKMQTMGIFFRFFFFSSVGNKKYFQNMKNKKILPQMARVGVDALWWTRKSIIGLV